MCELYIKGTSEQQQGVVIEQHQHQSKASISIMKLLSKKE